MEELNVKFENIDIENQELNVEFQNIEVLPEVQLQTPVLVQTQGLPEKDAMLFIGDCAEGKRKIAKAVRNKYEGTSGTASEITEYSTFEELSNKISQIPVEVPLGNAMEQNGGVLPFYDVYNEALKAIASVGTEYKGVCAFELYKWDYNNDHKITLSGADAYYVNDNNELLGSMSEYQFNDLDNGKTNRFVIFFFKNKQYSMPPYLPSHGVKGIISIKGNPLIIINETVPYLFYIRTYEGDLEVKSQNDFYIANTSNLREIDINHIKNISTSNCIRNNTNLFNISIGVKEINGGANQFFLYSVNKCVFFPNLELITNLNQLLGNNNGGSYYMFAFPKLKKIQGKYFTITNSAKYTVNEFNLDSLEIIELSTTYPLFGWIELKSPLKLPKLHKCNALMASGNNNIYDSVIPSIQLGDGQKDGVAGDIVIFANGKANTTLTNLTVAKGFKAKLNLTGCNGLSREVLVDILNNLADLMGESSLIITLGATLYDKLTADDILIATNKNWQVVK